jgi:hypothetical protein
VASSSGEAEGRRPRPGSAGRGRRTVRGEGQRGLGPSPRVCGAAQPISSSALPFVSFTNFRTNGMESAAQTV